MRTTFWHFVLNFVANRIQERIAMRSVGPIDKVRDTIANRLTILLGIWATSEVPDVQYCDTLFTEINTVHPTLYTDLLKPWTPIPTFLNPQAVVATGFQYPTLPFVAPIVPPNVIHVDLYERTLHLLEDISYYTSNDWTAKYKELIEEYTFYRGAWIPESLQLAYLKRYVYAADRSTQKLLNVFSPVLSAKNLSVLKPINWQQLVDGVHAATQPWEVYALVQDYLMTVIVQLNGKHKPIREVPMPVSVCEFGQQIDDYIDDRVFVPDAIAYGGQVAYTYAINLLATESEKRGQYYHILGKDITKPCHALTVEQRERTLCVVTAPLDLNFLYHAADKNLPTLIFDVE